MGTGINRIGEDYFREINFNSPVACDNNGIANAPEEYTFQCKTSQQLLKKYGNERDILLALGLAPVVPAKADPAYIPGLPDMMVVIRA